MTGTSSDLTREEFVRFLRPTVRFRGGEHAVARILSADETFVEYETFCGETVLSARRSVAQLGLSFPWDGESYSGCEQCLDGAVAAPPLPDAILRRQRTQRRWLQVLAA